MEAKDLFYTEGMRKRLENLSHSESGNYNSHLIFSENTRTDGKVMQINPYFVANYSEEVIKKTCEFFHIDYDMFVVANMDAKASTTHESAHDLLSNFNLFQNIDYDMYMETDYGKKIIQDIFNIVEDAFIEKAICAIFKGAKKYILFSNAIAYNARESINDMPKTASKVDIFLEWATQYTILGQVKGTVTDEVVLKAIAKTEPMFNTAKISLKSEVRYEFSKRIYAVVKDLLYDATKENKHQPYSNSPPSNPQGQNGKSSNEKNGDSNAQKLSKNQEFSNSDSTSDKKDTTSEKNDKGSSPQKEDNSSPKKSKSTSSNTGNSSDTEEFTATNFSKEELEELMQEISVEEMTTSLEKEKFVKEAESTKKEEQSSQTKKEELSKLEYSKVNKNIQIEANFPNAVDASRYSSEYVKIFSKVSGIVSTFVRQLKKLEEKNEDFERGLEMGTSLDSTKFGRRDRKFWKEEVENKEPVKLSIVILVDGSGSTRCMTDKLQETCIAVYETAKQLKLPIAIVEERAIYGKPLVQQNVKVDFDSSPAMKYNIASITSNGGTREGVSLLWTYEYQKKTCPNATKRLFIVLSDGEPQHDGYTRPFNIKDSKASADKIQKDKNCKLVAVSLTDEAYAPLQEIYKHVVSCSNNLNNLPSSLIKLIKKALQG